MSMKNIKLKEKAIIILKAQNIEASFTTKICACYYFSSLLNPVEYSSLISSTFCKRV